MRRYTSEELGSRQRATESRFRSGERASVRRIVIDFRLPYLSLKEIVVDVEGQNDGHFGSTDFQSSRIFFGSEIRYVLR